MNIGDRKIYEDGKLFRVYWDRMSLGGILRVIREKGRGPG